MKKKHLLSIGTCGIVWSKQDLDFFQRCLSGIDLNLTCLERSIPSDFLSEICLNTVTTVSDHGDDEMFRRLDEINEVTPFDGMICHSENLIQLSATICERYNLPGNSIRTAINTTNKYRMRLALQKGGVEIPEFHAIHSKKEAILVAKKLGYPCIIKPTQQYFSRGVKIIESEEELLQSFDWTLDISQKNSDDKFILIEKYIGGEEYSAEVVVNKGKIELISYTDKYLAESNFRDEVSHIHPHLFDTNLNLKLEEILNSTVQAVGIEYGGCHIEFKIDSNKVYIIEAASRLGGGAIPILVKLSRNIDLINMVARVALQEPVVIAQPKDHFAGIRFITSDNDGETISGSISNEIRSVPGIINATLLFDDKINIKLESSGCQRIGYIIGRNRDKDTLVESLNAAENIVKENLNHT